MMKNPHPSRSSLYVLAVADPVVLESGLTDRDLPDPLIPPALYLRRAQELHEAPRRFLVL